MTIQNLTLSLSVLALTAGLAQAQSLKSAPLQSASVLEFADADALFVADSIAGEIQAFSLSQAGAAPAEAAPDNLLDLDELLAGALGADPRRFTWHDLAVHPVTRDAYISLTLTIDGAEHPAVVTVARNGTVRRLDVTALPSDIFTRQEPADENVTFWRDIPAATFTVTDLDFANGELFVSGLSTA